MKKQIIFSTIFLALFFSKLNATCVWTGMGDGMTWSDGGNWSCGHPPGMMDEVVIPAFALITMDITSTVKSLDLDGGAVITGGGELLSVTTGIDWKSGTLAANVTLLGGGMSMVTGSSKTLSKKLIIKSGNACTWDAGTFNINTGGELMIEAGASFGTSFNGFIDFTSGTKGKITNAGIFAKAGGMGLTHVHVDFENAPTGGISAMSGTLEFFHGFIGNAGGMDISSGATLLLLDDSSHGASATFAGTGTLELQGTGPHTFANTYTGGLALILSADAVAIDGSLSFSGSVTIESGLIDGTGTLTIAGTGEWTDGALDVATTVSASGSLALSGSSDKVLENTLTQTGTATWSDGDLALQNGGIWSNGGTFHASSTGSIIFSGTAGSFSNSGTFRKTTGGTLTVHVPFSNSGTLKGTGTLLPTGGLTNTGTVAPGLSPGSLTISGDYTNGALLDIEIENDGMGNTTNDLLTVTNNATLDGTLKVTETGTVPNGTYVILQCQGTSPCISGTFDVLDLPSGYSHTISATEVSVTKALLPVELVDFQAFAEGEKVKLIWETASELNNMGFYMERSSDNFVWSTLGFVEGHGSTSIGHSYFFLDEKPLPDVNYYRLRQMDFNEQWEYSKIVSVKIGAEGGGIRMFPNPATSMVSLVIKTGYTGEAILTLFDLTGRLVKQQEHLLTDALDSQASLNVGLEGLPAGTYFVKVSAGRMVWQGRLVVERQF